MCLILVVEDSQDNFDLVDDALDSAHDLAHARAGCDGLAQAKSLKPDLILLDMGLELDGVWTKKRVLFSIVGLLVGYLIYFQAKHFETPTLRQRHPDDLLYYIVPESYRPEEPTGLIVLMHGGSKGSNRKMPHWYIRTDGKGSKLGLDMARTGMIAVAPSAPASGRYERCPGQEKNRKHG